MRILRDGVGPAGRHSLYNPNSANVNRFRLTGAHLTARREAIGSRAAAESARMSRARRQKVEEEYTRMGFAPAPPDRSVAARLGNKAGGCAARVYPVAGAGGAPWTSPRMVGAAAGGIMAAQAKERVPWHDVTRGSSRSRRSSWSTSRATRPARRPRAWASTPAASATG